MKNTIITITIDPAIVKKYTDDSIPKKEKSELIRRFNEMHGYALKSNATFWLKMKGRATVTLSQKEFLESEIGTLWSQYNPTAELTE